MYTTIYTASLVGMDARCVEVEADILHGLPKFSIVGLPDAAVQEARERIRSAITNAGVHFPQTRITVNLAPAHVRKEGTVFDLPIALALLIAKGILPKSEYSRRMFIGELALDGHLRPVRGVIAIATLARTLNFRELYVPVKNASEAALVDDIAVVPVTSLPELIDHLTQRSTIRVRPHWTPRRDLAARYSTSDFCDIRGQEHAKRALEIAAAGGHNVLLSGPPGAGKTLLARTMVSILPPMTLEESLEVTRIYSVAGNLLSSDPLIVSRPFRAPHHSASGVALIGGGTVPRPGEISLAHRGVLFLDEFPEFPRIVIESLRQPLEEGVITVSRAAGSYQFPAKCILVSAMNPCPCGYYGYEGNPCSCTSMQIQKYHKKISGPLLDRIDLHIDVPRVPFEKLVQGPPAESSSAIRTRVLRARARQYARLTGTGILTNAEMTSRLTKLHCPVDASSSALLRIASSRYAFSARSYFRILKVARTIADLADEDHVNSRHVAEAIQHRVKVE